MPKTKEQRAEYYQKNKEKILQRNTKYYEDHREAMLIKQKDYLARKIAEKNKLQISI